MYMSCTSRHSCKSKTLGTADWGSWRILRKLCQKMLDLGEIPACLWLVSRQREDERRSSQTVGTGNSNKSINVAREHSASSKNLHIVKVPRSYTQYHVTLGVGQIAHKPLERRGDTCKSSFSVERFHPLQLSRTTPAISRSSLGKRFSHLLQPYKAFKAKGCYTCKLQYKALLAADLLNRQLTWLFWVYCTRDLCDSSTYISPKQSRR